MWIFIALKKYRFVLETVVSTGILIHEPTRFHILARNGKWNRISSKVTRAISCD